MDLALGVNNVSVKKDDGSTVTLAQIARWNEWGTETAPPRPAFRMAMERTVKKNKKRVQAMLKNMILAKHRGDKAHLERIMTVFLTSMGQQAAAEVKRIIEGAETVANAPRTVAKKGFDHPLYETGALLKNIRYEVQK
jgi:hypothetical protein